MTSYDATSKTFNSREAKPAYVARLRQLIQRGSGLCVGLDPSVATLRGWGLSADIAGLQAFCDTMLEVCLAEGVGIVKPQSAFFEQFGWRGVKVLQHMTESYRQNDVMVILDAKRGDIGSTSAAYAHACVSAHDLEKADAVTVNPYLGFADLQPFLQKTVEEPVGVFVVVRSSNAGSGDLQQAVTARGHTVAADLAAGIHAFNSTRSPADALGPVGAVIGVTLDDTQSVLERMPSAFLLCPGIGAQGATPQQAIERLGRFARQAIFPLSRGIAASGPDVARVRASIKQWKSELGKALAAS